MSHLILENRPAEIIESNLHPPLSTPFNPPLHLPFTPPTSLLLELIIRKSFAHKQL